MTKLISNKFKDTEMKKRMLQSQSAPAAADNQDWAGLFWNPPKFVLDAQFKQLEQKFLKPSEWDQAFRQSLVYLQVQ